MTVKLIGFIRHLSNYTDPKCLFLFRSPWTSIQADAFLQSLRLMTTVMPHFLNCEWPSLSTDIWMGKTCSQTCQNVYTAAPLHHSAFIHTRQTFTGYLQTFTAHTTTSLRDLLLHPQQVGNKVITQNHAGRSPAASMPDVMWELNRKGKLPL